MQFSKKPTFRQGESKSLTLAQFVYTWIAVVYKPNLAFAAEIHIYVITTGTSNGP